MVNSQPSVPMLCATMALLHNQIPVASYIDIMMVFFPPVTISLFAQDTPQTYVSVNISLEMYPI